MRRGEPTFRLPLRAAVVLFVNAVLSVVLIGCTSGAGPDPAAAPAGANLEARVAEYLTLKQQHEWNTIYDQFLDPAKRETLEKEVFLQKRELAFDVLSFEIEYARVDGDRGEALANMEAMIPVLRPGGSTQMIQKKVKDPQEWVSRDGKWYIELAS